MSDADSNARSGPLRSLWFKPSEAVDAALARQSHFVVIAIAALGSAVGFSAAVSQHLPSLALANFWQATAGVALASAFFGVVVLFLQGWITNGVAHALGGVGSPKAVRAAYAWSSIPLFAASGVLVMADWAGVSASGPAKGPWIALNMLVLIGAIWSFLLYLAMLARVQNFGRVRAFFAYLVGNVFFALALALAIRVLLFQPFNTPSGSMIPTLQVGDYFFVSKFSYGYSRFSFPFAPAVVTGRIFAQQPGRGDVIVFHHPTHNADYVKRVISLPGDKIQLKANRVYINDVLVERSPVNPGFVTTSLSGETIAAPTYMETPPGGPSYEIVQIQGDQGFNADTAAFVTPPGHYFVMGDNRDNSTDSRISPEQGGVGFVPFENIIGRAALIFFAASADAAGKPLAVRPERIGQVIK